MIRIAIGAVLTLATWSAWSQQRKIDIDLNTVIRLAQGEAPAALIAETRLSNNYWRYQSILADFRPQLSFRATIPDLNRTIDNIIVPDGTEIFINRSLMQSSAGIQMSQRVSRTGGLFYASSNLRRIDIFGQPTGTLSSYLSAPMTFGFQQPLFQFNADKWQRQIEQLNFDIAKKAYAEEREQIAYDAVELFFTLYVSQLNLAEANRLKAYSDSLYDISQGRFEVGRIAETDLLQIELRARNAEAEAANEELNLQAANENLRIFLGIRDNVSFNLFDPETIPQYDIEPQLALAQAKRYRSQTAGFAARLMQAEMNLEEAQRSGGLNVDLSGFFGLSQTGASLGSAYRNPIDNERLTLGLQVPIADWGKQRARREIARSNLELTRQIVEQENITFERQIVLRVQQMDLKRSQHVLAGRAAEVALKRVDIAKNRYQIGKIDVTELNIALNEYDAARRAYIQALWNLWTAHYEIRNLTLYDFHRMEPLHQDDLDR